MTDIAISEKPAGGPHPKALAQALALGFGYWLFFLLVLEPGNILRAAHGLVWSREFLRIIAASTLGASATPALFALVRRYPIEGTTWVRRAAMEAAGCVSVAAVLILISCVLADWFLPSEHRPFGVALLQELEGNGPLLVFAIVGLLAIAHAVRFLSRNDGRVMVPAADAAAPVYLRRVPVKSRGRVTMVEVSDIDWIETQGNYLALHIGPAAHLIRESLSRFERGLDPERFVRVHRRMIVAVDRIGAVTSLGAGDAMLTLKNGTQLRMSRGFRDRVAVLAPSVSGQA
ncbi:MAG: LytTR family transcriptional regulator [Hyphomicrobiales bacterium]|nr:LytTR family transcriptional regulator [Alphaproteobacteria bacterium]MDE2283719.1 LytTR family transcriptional regulator [Hyphomicrobiales bacterium]